MVAGSISIIQADHRPGLILGIMIIAVVGAIAIGIAALLQRETNRAVTRPF